MDFSSKHIVLSLEERLEEAEEAFRTEELALMNKYKETEGKKEFQRLKGRGQLKLHQMKK